MPAIPLRSVQNTLRSPCDPHTDQPSIRLRSVAIALLLSPLIPQADRSPALGRWARRSRAPEKGSNARGRKGPQRRQHTTNGQPSTDPVGIMRARPRPTNRLTSLSTSNTALGPRLGTCAAHNPHDGVQHQVLGIASSPVCAIGGGISRAGANSAFHSIEADQARARRSTAGETAECAEPSEIAWGPLLGRGGWGEKQRRRYY